MAVGNPPGSTTNIQELPQQLAEGAVNEPIVAKIDELGGASGNSGNGCRENA